MRSIFKEGRKYTFNDYFEMGNPTAEIAAALGYSFAIQAVDLPRCQNVNQEILDRVSSTYYALVPKISLNSETAKREVMIAPVLHTVIQRVNAALHIEYPVEVDEKLSGTIDYFFRSSEELIVVEAKKGDFERGFNQLAAEMIAMDKYEEQTELENVYGAITIGEVWRFAVLERKRKRLIKDVHTFRFPEDLSDIFSFLTGILEQEHEKNEKIAV